MSAYTHVKVGEIANQGPNFGLDERDFELRFLRSDLGCESCGVSFKRLGAGYREPFGHRHKRQEEVYVLVSGKARMKLDDEVIDLEPWSAVRVPPETMRALEAGPDEDAIFVVIGAPNTGPGDGEVEQGWWSD